MEAGTAIITELKRGTAKGLRLVKIQSRIREVIKKEARNADLGIRILATFM